MELIDMLHEIDLFEGLNTTQISRMAAICCEKHFDAGELIATEGEAGDELYIITEGFVEVFLGECTQNPPRVVVCLGVGQLIGEMALLDQGLRSASIRATTHPTVVQVIHRCDFERLCSEDNQIGYIVMRNLAADLSFKLRHRNLIER